MATTPKGIYYPNDYNEIADIPEDMKKMAESIEEVFEDTDSDLSDIKEEQTTQNNRLNSLEVDNTTNKSDILTNKQEINNIKTEQTEQNTNISTNATNIESLQEENENLKKIVSQLPQVTGQGTSITLENTIEAQFTIFDVEGNSTQETTEGNQLLDLSNFVSTTTKGITFTKNDDDSISFNGTSTDAITLDTPINLELTQNIDYTLSKMSTYAAGQYAISLRKEDTSVIGSEGLDSGSSSRTYKLEENVTAKYFRIYIPKGVTINHTIYPMVNEGSTATNYEPYTGGIASPNPNYEQPILSAGDNENIWNGEIERGAINGDGLDVDATNRVRNVGYYELNKGTYTLSYKGAEQSVVYIFNANKVKVNNPSWENGKSTFTLEENGYIKYALKQLDNREMNVNDVSEIKLEKGNKATPYSPYGMGSINEKIKNKNWFNKNGNFKTYNATVTPIDTGIKVENNDGGTYRSVWCEIGKDELLGKTLTIQTSISTYNGAIPRIIVVFNNETAQYIAQIKTITDTTEGTLVNIPNSFP